MKNKKTGRPPKIPGRPNIIPVTAKLSHYDYQRILQLANYFDMPKMTLTRLLILYALDLIEDDLSSATSI